MVTPNEPLKTPPCGSVTEKLMVRLEELSAPNMFTIMLPAEPSGGRVKEYEPSGLTVRVPSAT